MRRLFNKTFEELVEENKKQLLSDPDEIKKIERRLEKKQLETASKE